MGKEEEIREKWMVSGIWYFEEFGDFYIQFNFSLEQDHETMKFLITAIWQIKSLKETKAFLQGMLLPSV